MFMCICMFVRMHACIHKHACARCACQVVAHCRRRRGNAFLSDKNLQLQLLELARRHCLLGDKPVLTDSGASSGAGVGAKIRRTMSMARRRRAEQEDSASSHSLRADVILEMGAAPPRRNEDANAGTPDAAVVYVSRVPQAAERRVFDLD